MNVFFCPAARILPAFVFLALLGAGPAPARQNEFQELTDGVYAHIVSPDSMFVGNTGVVVLGDGVLVFDTHFSAEAGRELSRKIRERTQRPVRYVALSHFHPDHTHGNEAFEGAALIMASGNTRRDMLEKDLPAINLAIRRAEAQIEQMRKALDLPADEGRRVALRKQLDERQAFLDSMSGMRIRPPIAVVERSLQIPDEVHPVEFRYLGPGHTDGDMVLYLPRDRIVFAGDVFFNAALPSTDDARMLDWIQTVVELLKIDADRFVPGHGPVAGRSEVEDFLRYLQDLRHLVEPYVQRGEPLEQVVREARLPERYAGYRFRNFFPANIKMMYSELRAIQLSAPTVEPPAADKPGAVPPMP